MKRILRSGAFLLALFILLPPLFQYYKIQSQSIVGLAYAQTGCSSLNQAQLLNEFADNQAPGSIVPGFIRNLICSVPNLLNATGVTAGSYTNTNLTVGADGRITSATNGSGGAAGAATLAGANAFTNTNTFASTTTFNNQASFASTVVARRTLNSNTTLCAALGGACTASGSWPGIDNVVCGDVSGGAVTLTMPPGTGTSIPNGFTLAIDDCKRQAVTHNLIISANSGQTISGAASITVATNGAGINAVWNSTDNDWNLF